MSLGSLTKPARTPTTPFVDPLLAIQILSGVEEQQGADRVDVAGKTPEPLLSLILRFQLGVHTHREVFQLLLEWGRNVKGGWWLQGQTSDLHPIPSESSWGTNPMVGP